MGRYMGRNMSRQLNKLTSLKIKAAKYGYHGDGGGLYLQVTKDGAKTWVYRYERSGIRREIGLGGIATVSLADARVAAGNCRSQLQAGIDPYTSKKDAAASARLEAAKSLTFAEAASKFIELNKSGWKNEKHAAQWASTISTYANPVFGKVAVKDVDTGLVLKAIESLWIEKTETASRVRGRVEKILDWATVRGYRTGENPARWKSHLDQVLPAPAKVKGGKKQPALPFTQMNEFALDLRKVCGKSATALEITILTALRTNAVINADWSEIDFENRIWTIPASRMKGDRNKTEEFVVPLSNRVVELFQKTPESKRHGLIFPGTKHGKPISQAALLKCVQDMNEKRTDNGLPRWVDPKQGNRDIVPHGFRSTFRDWAAEMTNTQNHVVEMALQHTIGNQVEASYRRGDLLKKRATLLAQWATYIDTKVGGTVIPLKKEVSA